MYFLLMIWPRWSHETLECGMTPEKGSHGVARTNMEHQPTSSASSIVLHLTSCRTPKTSKNYWLTAMRGSFLAHQRPEKEQKMTHKGHGSTQNHKSFEMLRAIEPLEHPRSSPPLDPLRPCPPAESPAEPARMVPGVKTAAPTTNPIECFQSRWHWPPRGCLQRMGDDEESN